MYSIIFCEYICIFLSILIIIYINILILLVFVHFRPFYITIFYFDDEYSSLTLCSFFVLQRSCESDQEDTQTKPASLIRRRLSSSSWTSLTSTFSSSVSQMKRVTGSHRNPELSSRALFIYFRVHFVHCLTFYYSPAVFCMSVTVRMAAIFHDTVISENVLFYFAHTLMCEGFNTHNTVR